MAKDEIPEGWIKVEDFMESKPSTIAEDVKKDFEIYHLLQEYLPEYVEKTWGYSHAKIEEIIRTMDPIGKRRREIQHARAVAELMHRVVGAEGS